MTREAYATQLRHLSELIVGAVHDDGPDATLEAIRRALGVAPPADVDPVVALVTVLAAQVDPETTPLQRLGWVAGFDGRLRPCGTEAAYKRHMRRRQAPCPRCRAAHAESERGRVARARARAAA